MVRRQNDSDFGRLTLLVLFLIGTISCSMVYLYLTVVFRSNTASISSMQEGLDETVDFDDWLSGKEEEEEERGRCCRGIEHLELWGDAVKWGSEFRINSSEDCCMACKNMCRGDGGPCLCNSWVFCGDKDACGSRFGEVFYNSIILFLIFFSFILPLCLIISELWFRFLLLRC